MILIFSIFILLIFYIGWVLKVILIVLNSSFQWYLIVLLELKNVVISTWIWFLCNVLQIKLRLNFTVYLSQINLFYRTICKVVGFGLVCLIDNYEHFGQRCSSIKFRGCSVKSLCAGLSLVLFLYFQNLLIFSIQQGQ